MIFYVLFTYFLGLFIGYRGGVNITESRLNPIIKGQGKHIAKQRNIIQELRKEIQQLKHVLQHPQIYNANETRT